MTHHRTQATPITRRTMLRGTTAIGIAGLGVTTAGTAAAQDGGEPAYGDWFDNVDNYEETVDRRGSDRVTITVGTSANGGAFGFDPAAVHVDPGRTIIWEWSGDAGSHNVVAEDGSFESDLVGDGGYTFEQTFTERGIAKYVCSPHERLGMRGAIVVGSPTAEQSGYSGGDLLTLGGGVGLVGGLVALFGVGTYGRSTE